MESALALTFGSIGEDELLARRQVPGRGWLMNTSPAWPWDFEIGWASVPGCLIVYAITTEKGGPVYGDPLSLVWKSCDNLW